MAEVTEACELIYDHADEDALIIFGACLDTTCDGEMRVTVVATGFQNFEASRGPRLRRVGENLDMPTHIREGRRIASQTTPSSQAGPMNASAPIKPLAPFKEEEDDELRIPAFIRKRMN
jgi:cell division protein FtsZ